MLIFGLINIFKSGRKNQALEPTNSKQGVLKRFFRGLVINGLNPMVLVFWIGMVTVSKVKFTADDGQIYIFLFSIVITVFITDNIKAFLAEKLSTLINAKYIRVLNTLVGIGFILFSIKLFHYGYEIGFSQAME